MDFTPPIRTPSAGREGDAEAEKKRKFCLIVDDNRSDQVLLRKALEENRVDEEVRFVDGGREMVDILEQGKPTLLRPEPFLPCLILLDLYMPRMDGHEALRIIKSDLSLKKIPTVILTSSHNLDDIVQSYHDGANSFLTKPQEYDRLVSLIGLVKHYWLEEAQLPP